MQPAAARHQDAQREADHQNEEEGRNQQRQGLQERRPQAQPSDEVEAGRTEGGRPKAARGVPGQAGQQRQQQPGRHRRQRTLQRQQQAMQQRLAEGAEALAMAGNESGQAVVEPVGHRPGGEEGFRTRGFRSVRSSRRFRGALLPRQACRVDAQPTGHALSGLGWQPGGPQLGALLQEEARLSGAITAALGHVENEPVEHLGRQLEFADERHHLRILLLQ